MNIVESANAYERWLKKQLGDDYRKRDIKKKHKKMAKDAFSSCARPIGVGRKRSRKCAPTSNVGPDVLAVGDIHVENFGTWRDREGRLIWGVNDFDEAAKMPHAHDIVRLATSGILAEVTGISGKVICDNILQGYREGVGNPQPFVLDREHKDLRKAFVVSEDERIDFWSKFDPEQLKKKKDKDIEPVAPQDLPRHFAQVLKRARPDDDVAFDYFMRSAGTGSLGRPRAFGTGEWRGDLIVREAKAIVRSGWALAHHASHNLRCEEIANGTHRAPDPTYRLRGRVLVRRLSPNDFKIEAKPKTEKGDKSGAQQDIPKARERREIVIANVLHAMGADLAAVHCGTEDKAALRDGLKGRTSAWLLASAEKAADAVRLEFKEWKAYHDALPDEDG